LAVRIPKPIAEQWGVHEGSAVEMVSRGNQVILRKKTHTLANLLATVTDKNRHTEVDTGPAQGNEAW
jgi:antitoxin component of MazEF toxin-antitoxin module